MLRRGEGEEVEDSSSHRAGLLNHKRGIEAAHPSCSSTSNEILAFLLQRRIIDPASRSNELLYFRYSDEVWGVKNTPGCDARDGEVHTHWHACGEGKRARGASSKSG